MVYEVASYRISTKVLTEEFTRRAAAGWHLVWQVPIDGGSLLVTWARQG